MEMSSLSPWLVITLSFLSAIIIGSLSVPPIVRLAKDKGLLALPNGRTSHSGAVPTLGGIGIFAGFKLSVLIFSSYTPFPELPFIAASCLLIFFSGLKDDIFIISPFSKIATQVLSSAIIIIFTDIRFTDLHGFLGFTNIPYVVSFLLTMFVIIVIINSFNLIDGIDGLAGAIGIVSATAFGLWFYMVGDFNYAIFSAAMAGSLIGFLRYNLSKGKYKIFMGDTGSLLIGFVVALLVIRFNELNSFVNGMYKIESSPAVAIGVLILPLYDTARVMIVRILRKQSPFKADRGHIHHKLLDLGYSHWKATLILAVSNIVFICIAYYYQYLGIIKLTSLLIAIATLAYFIPITMILRRFKKMLLPEKDN